MICVLKSRSVVSTDGSRRFISVSEILLFRLELQNFNWGWKNSIRFSSSEANLFLASLMSDQVILSFSLRLVITWDHVSKQTHGTREQKYVCVYVHQKSNLSEPFAGFFNCKSTLQCHYSLTCLHKITITCQMHPLQVSLRLLLLGRNVAQKLG